MHRQKAADAYIWSVAWVGIGLAVLTTIIQAPVDLSRSTTQPRDILVDAAVLVVLTFLSSISPVQTKVGATVTVGLAPMFGAFLTLVPWAVMWVAALGTIDERVPGRDIPWNRFLFNRGMSVIQYGVPSLIFWSAGFQSHRGTWFYVLPLAVLVIVGLNVGQVSLVFSLVQGIGVINSARKMISGHAATYIAMPLIGYLIYILIAAPVPAQRLVVFLLYGPVLVYRASLQKQQRLDQWLRDSFIMQSRIVDKRDGQTFGHSQRVGELSEAVARRLHLGEAACNTIRVAGILHDLGKIAIPDSILLKPAKLTPEEYEIIKTHPVEGANILAEHPEQRDVANIVLHHHEKWDGSGYPDGKKQEEIPIGARIVDACDAFDTITQARVFRPTVKTPSEAMQELSHLAGKWYDPAVIRALEEIAAERWGVERPTQPAPAKQREGYLQVFSSRPFRFLLIGQSVSYFGDMMNTTGLAIMLYLVTKSPSLLALGMIAKAAPTILFGLIAGSFVDRFNRQRLMIGADLMRALLTVAIPFFAYLWLPGVFIAVFLIASASAFFNPAKQAIIPNLVPADRLVRANSLVSSSEKVMELLGYSSAGLIAALVSWAPLFLIDSASYLISAGTLLGVVDRVRPGIASRMKLFDDVVEGAKYIMRSPTLRSTMALTFTAVFFVGMTFPILVIIAYGQLRGGAFGYGALEAAIGAGAAIGALVAPVVLRRIGAGLMILAGVAGMGASYALTGFSHALFLAAVFLFAGGIANTIYYVPLISVTQREAVDRMRGRVMSTRFLLVQLGLLGGIALSGPLTDRVGAAVVFVAAGALMVSAALVGLAFRNLRDASLQDEVAGPVLTASASG